MAIAIIIPARYGSTRFPGKPLALLGDKAMVNHVYDRAKEAIAGDPDVKIVVATDDKRIVLHCEKSDIPVVMTPEDCASGSDRVIEAADQLGMLADDVIINLQGDVPLISPLIIKAVLDEFWTHPGTKIATPVKRLKWNELDALRELKKATPFSGTTVALSTQNRALWFSKNIIPSIRKEDELRAQSPFSPVYQHIGLYGYQITALERFTNIKPGVYEQMEGLEQLRFLENGMPIQCIEIDSDIPTPPGIDSPEDLERAKEFLKQTA